LARHPRDSGSKGEVQVARGRITLSLDGKIVAAKPENERIK
jgi:hypothetical protein